MTAISSSMKIFNMRIKLTKGFRVVYVDSVTAEVRAHEAGLSSMPLDAHIEALNRVIARNIGLLSDLPAEKTAHGPKQIECVVYANKDKSIRTSTPFGSTHESA